MSGYRRPKLGYLSRLEVVVVEAAATTFGALRYMAGWDPRTSVVGAAVIALFVIAVMEVMRLRSVSVDVSEAPPSMLDKMSDAVGHQSDGGGVRRRRTPKSMLILAMFSPVIAAFLIFEFVVLYAVPVGLVFFFCLIFPQSSWSSAGVALALGVGAGIINELIVILPARHFLSQT